MLKKYLITLLVADYEALKKIGKSRGETVATILREAISQYLKNKVSK